MSRPTSYGSSRSLKTVQPVTFTRPTERRASPLLQLPPHSTPDPPHVAVILSHVPASAPPGCDGPGLVFEYEGLWTPPHGFYPVLLLPPPRFFLSVGGSKRRAGPRNRMPNKFWLVLFGSC